MSNLYSEPYGDFDAATSSQQVPKVYKDPTPPSKELLAGKDIDEGHGGINDIVRATDGAASSTTMTTYNCSSPTPEEMGIN